MAAPSGSWRKHLNKHPIFDVLREHRKDLKKAKDSKELLVIKDGEIFVWNAYNACILTTNLKPLVQKSDKLNHQSLLCTNAPVFDVDRLLFSRTGLFLALIGQKGITVVELPQRWGKHSEFEGGKARIACRTIPIAERFFTCHNKVKVLDVAWHPGSNSDTHISLLTSDNVIRIYSLLSPQTPLHTYPLSDQGTSIGRSSACIHISAALGDQAVAFTFGEPIELTTTQRPSGLKKLPVSSQEDSSLLWPLYILWGNGDIYRLLSSPEPIKNFKSEIQGPLSLYPPAEDNYGTDACSVLCLQMTPPVLVVATPTGKLYHCVVLSKTDDDETLSEVSFQGSERRMYPEPSLYLYESVELELSLTTVDLDTDELVADDFTCPIRLHSDPGCGDRYHCSHSAGVHSVVLPWAHKFQQFCDQEGGATEGELLEEDMEQATVEHLVCTKPLPSSAPSPVLGICVTADRLLGPTLLCLTSTLECVTLPLLMTLHDSPPPLLSASPSRKMESPLRKLHKEPFDTHIKRILQKTTANPLLKSGRGAELSGQECFQLLSRATQVFREEYVQKLDLARDEIVRRLRVLKEQKELQMSDVEECKQQRNILTQRAEDLAEKYQDAVDHQEMLTDRIETVLKKLQSRLPILSDAERNMHQELKDMKEKIDVYKNSIKQLQIKSEYQQAQMCPSTPATPSRSFTPAPSKPLSKDQSQHLKTLLKDEGEQISDLVKQINGLKVQLRV